MDDSIPSIVAKFGANGDGVENNSPIFALADLEGGLLFVPKPEVEFKFLTPFRTENAAWLVDPATPWDELTNNGQFNFYKGRATGHSRGANIWRLSDRVFVGEAASKYAGNNLGNVDGGISWFGDMATSPAYLGFNSRILVTNGEVTPGDGSAGNQPYNIVSAVKTSLSGNTTAGTGSIAFGAAIVADAAGKSAWAFIAETQREAGAGQTYGLEVAAKNKGNNTTITPNGQVPGVFGIWLAGGGDNAFGGLAANPSTAGMVFLKNAHSWNSGIVFMKDSLTGGQAIAMSSEGIGGSHHLVWFNTTGNAVFTIQSSASDGVAWGINRSNGALTVTAAGQSLLTITTNGIGFLGTSAVAAKTGWGVPTGMLVRSSYPVYSGVVHGNVYSKSKIQSLDDAVRDVSQRLGALIADLHQTSGYGLVKL